MKCKKCGSELEPNAKFCITCGEKVEELNNQAVAAQSPQPILPDAPEAPLPGTANKVTEDPVEKPTPEVQATAPVAQTPVAPQAPVTQPTTNKNSNMFVIAIIVVLAICAGVLLFVLLYGTNGLKNKDKTTTTTTKVTTTKKRTTTIKKVREEVVNGVSITIPDGWTYSTFSTLGKITNASGGTEIYIYPIYNDKFVEYQQNATVLEQMLIEKGNKVLDKQSGQIGNQVYIMFNILTKNGVPEIMMFTNMPNGDVIRFEVLKVDIDSDELLNVTNSIASSARISQGEQNFSSGIGDYL